MAKQITADDVAAAEAELIKAKKGKNPDRKREAMEHVAELRSAFRAQEVAAGRRQPGHAVVTEES